MLDMSSVLHEQGGRPLEERLAAPALRLALPSASATSTVSSISSIDSQKGRGPPRATGLLSSQAMLSSQPQTDLQQLMLASLDPQLRSLYLSQLLGHSPSSSAPPSATSETPPLPPWLAALAPPSSNASSSLFEQLQLMGSVLGPNTTAALGGNAALAAVLQQLASQTPSPLTPSSLITSPSQSFNANSTKTGEAYCELCDKNFCNRYFLKTHRQKRHGIFDDDSPSPTKSPEDENPAANGTNETSSPAEKKAKREEDEERNAESSEMKVERCVCDECGREFDGVFGLVAHKAAEHANSESNEKEEKNEKAMCEECGKEFESPPFLQQHVLLQHPPFSLQGLAHNLAGGMGQLPLGGLPLPFMLPGALQQQFLSADVDNSTTTTPKGLNLASTAVKRQYSSSGKNYCDLCNKEVCNKYFLRTHMLKMHGIVIDENKTVIANIDTLEKERQGALSFRCDICMMELKSRQLLRSHKQEAHGVAPLCTPSRRTQTPAKERGSTDSDCGERCPVCDRRIFSSLLQEHVLREHSADLTADLLLCLQKVLLLPHSFMVQQTKREEPPRIFSERMEEETKNFLQCHNCPYTTRHASNLQVHMERHERLDELKDEEDDAMRTTTEVALQMAAGNQLALSCGDCSLEFPSVESLAAHVARAHSKTPAKSETSLADSCPKCGLRTGRDALLEHLLAHFDAEKEPPIDGHSHTSGSLSPNGDSEMFAGRVQPSNGRPFVLQAVSLRGDPSVLAGEVVVQLPLRAPLSSPVHLSVDLVPVRKETATFHV